MRERRDAWMSLAAGACVALLALAAVLLLALDDFASARSVLLQTGVHLAVGREAAIPTGIAAGLPWPTAWLAALALEWTMLLTLFPLVVLLQAHLHRWPRVRAIVENAQARARRRPGTGVLALGALTLLPGLPVGALTSALIGETFGLPARRFLPTLMAAIVLANLYVALGVAALASRFPDARLAAAVMAVLALLGALATVVWRVRRAEA